MTFEILQIFNFVLLSAVICLLVYNHKQHRIIKKKMAENKDMYYDLVVKYENEHMPKAIYFDRLLLNAEMLGGPDIDLDDLDQLAALGAVTRKYIKEYQTEVMK